MAALTDVIDGEEEVPPVPTEVTAFLPPGPGEDEEEGLPSSPSTQPSTGAVVLPPPPSFSSSSSSSSCCQCSCANFGEWLYSCFEVSRYVPRLPHPLPRSATTARWTVCCPTWLAESLFYTWYINKHWRNLHVVFN